MNSPAEALLVEERLKNQELEKQIAGLEAIVAAHELMRTLKIKMTENADTPQSVIEILNTDFQDLV